MKRLVLSLSVFLLAYESLSQVPERFNYQGRLLDGTNMVNGSHKMEVHLYDAPTVGTQLYGETQSVVVVDGLYSFQVGASNTSPGSLSTALQGGAVYLQITVDGTPLTPRERVCASAYALIADERDPVWQSASNLYVNKSGDSMTGALNITTPSGDLVIGSSGTEIMIGNSANGGFWGLAVGAGANGYDYGTAVGDSANGNRGVAVGRLASGSSFGAALGKSARGSGHGAALGESADGTNYGVAVGFEANGAWAGAAVGARANAFFAGTALGDESEAQSFGVAVGALADGSDSNIAIGCFSRADGGDKRTAIGFGVTNQVDNSAALRGDLYLDGGAGVFCRPTFGTGGWTNLLSGTLSSDTNYVKKTGDTMTGALNVNAGGGSDLIVSSAGTDVMIGGSANGQEHGAALGSEANGSWYGAALGLQSKGGISGVGVGATANGQDFGTALGNSANAARGGSAVGVYAYAPDYGVAVGRSARGSSTNIAIGFQANAASGIERVAIGHNVTNDVDGTTRLRGDLYLDGGDEIYYRPSFGTGSWTGRTSMTDSRYVNTTGDVMTGTLRINVGAENDLVIANSGSNIAIGAAANAPWGGVAIGRLADAAAWGTAVGHGSIAVVFGVAVGHSSVGDDEGVAVGYRANGFSSGAGLGNGANGAWNGVAVGHGAVGYTSGVAIGRSAMGVVYAVGIGKEAVASLQGVAVGYQAEAHSYGVAAGRSANGSTNGTAVGYGAAAANSGSAVGGWANGEDGGAAVGMRANAYIGGVAIGWEASGTSNAVGVGYGANGNGYGIAIGYGATGSTFGVAAGLLSRSSSNGVAVGYLANGDKGGIALGYQASAAGGSYRVAIGQNTVNTNGNSVVLRGDLYLDGGNATAIRYRTTFGSGGWSVKNFVIDHPLDPEHWLLRHACIESPEVLNTYSGNVMLDENAERVIELPAYFKALNTDPRYGLTPVGTSMPGLYVKEKIADNRFKIAGGVPGGEVSWRVVAVRNDPAVRDNPMIIEQQKTVPGLLYTGQ